MLTVFIIPLADSRTEKTIESFVGIECDVKVLEDRNFNEVAKTKWKMFMFNNEVLTEELNVAIPIFLKEGTADIYKIYKQKGKEITIAPRLFKSEIELKKDCLLPVKGIEKYKIETILNGFIN